MSEDAGDWFETLGLTEYEATALAELLGLGRTTAPNLSEATGIPKARIYGVLDSLSDRGYVKVIPGRPKEYQAKPPEDVLDRAVENQRQDFEEFATAVEEMRAEFLAEFQPRFEVASEDIRPAEELFHVVDLGEPSERETRRIYREADEQVHAVTKSFEFFDSVEPAFAGAYLNHARQQTPTLTTEAREYLATKDSSPEAARCVGADSAGASTQTVATDTVERLAIANARLKLSETVTSAHIEMAGQLYANMFHINQSA